MKFEIYVGRDRQYHCRLKASNGEIVMWSEGYTTKANARKAAEWVKTNAPYAPIVEI